MVQNRFYARGVTVFASLDLITIPASRHLSIPTKGFSSWIPGNVRIWNGKSGIDPTGQKNAQFS